MITKVITIHSEVAMNVMAIHVIVSDISVWPNRLTLHLKLISCSIRNTFGVVYITLVLSCFFSTHCHRLSWQDARFELQAALSHLVTKHTV